MKKAILIIGIVVISVIVAFVIMAGIGEDMTEEKIPLKLFKNISAEQLQKISQKRVYFGHQSVGSNIMKGLAELNEAHQTLQLNIVESGDLQGVEGAVFAHSRVGKNRHPETKVDDFVRLVENGLNQRVDIAFFKFCYADIDQTTDVAKVFDYYKKAMDGLKTRYPGITFLHCTVPYYRKTGGLKGIVKRIMGRDKNIPREQFNDMLRASYKPGEYFDLARFESTYPDGRRERGDKSKYALVPRYTKDGGHLNKKGREMMAIQLVDFLSSL